MQESSTSTSAMLARGLLLGRWSCSTIAKTSPFAHRNLVFFGNVKEANPPPGSPQSHGAHVRAASERATVLDPEAPAASGPLGSWIIVSAQRFTE